MTQHNHGIVIFSGGQDSTTVLGVALQECAKVTCITFEYGQRHVKEIDAAKEIISVLNEDDPNAELIDHLVINLAPVLENMRSSALINPEINVNAQHETLAGLPASFVPARNALFITTAFGIAIELKADAIYTGVCQTDYSGYPDCRQDFILMFNSALNVGYEQDIPILTPLMHLTKAQTFALAKEHGVDDLVLDLSRTCYEGSDASNPWGMGCGECAACQLREKGWNEYQAELAG